MIALLLAVLVASLLGSLHCAGMCGGLVAVAVTPAARTPGAGVMLPVASAAWLHAAYQGGRLAAYLVLGAIAGFAGGGLRDSGWLAGLQHNVGLVAGAAMVLIALISLAHSLGVQTPLRIPAGRIAALLAPAHRVAAGLDPIPRSLLIGALSGLLPCGWLYMFVLAAAGAADPLAGAAVMAAFWLGAVPILVGVGTAADWLRSHLGRFAPAATALLLLGVGVFMTLHRAALPTFASSAAPPALDASTVRALDSGEAPCCQSHEP